MSRHMQYRQKLRSAKSVAEMVRSGDRIDYGYCATTCRYVDRELAKRLPELVNLTITGGILQWTPAIFEADPDGQHFIWQSVHLSAIERKRYAQGGAVPLPMRYSELIRWYRENFVPNDFIFLQVAPMDERGMFNFGPSCSHLQAACQTARVVVVEVNDKIPVCLGEDNAIHIDEVDFIVEGDNPDLVDVKTPAPGPVDMMVAKRIVEMIPDGACLQLGIGGMPNAVGSLLVDSGLLNLGVHTEMYVDAFVDLTESGLITGSRKKVYQGLQSYTFAAGSQRMYDFMHNNQQLYTAPVEHINDVRTIANNPEAISINNAINVDLFGQVSSETAGFRAISGAGGQLDYVLGAYLSPGGKSIICLSSTYQDKQGKAHSRILPSLPQGTVVTDTRANAHWVVTEHGAFNCKGQNVWQRCEGLIGIAHPDFREELTRQAVEAGIFRRSNKR